MSPSTSRPRSQTPAAIKLLLGLASKAARRIAADGSEADIPLANVHVGDKLIGATLNTRGALVMKSEHVGSATVLSQIVQMVAMAQRSRAPMQRMADALAGYFV